MNRRRLLLGAAAIGLRSPLARAAQGTPQAPTLASFGARGDGRTDDTAALIRALTEHAGDLVIGPGTYRYARTLQIGGSHRTIRFDGAAVLLGDDPSVTGLEIRNATGITLSGASLAWRQAPRQRIRFGAGVLVMGGIDVRLERVQVEGFGGAGLLFESCLRAVVSQARVRKTLADGVHFANCEQPLAEDVDCQDTGDDGLAFVNYRRLPDAADGTARRIAIVNAAARGISVVGQSDVKVSQFQIRRTRASGIYVAQEESYATRVPRNALFENGSVDEAGVFDGPGGNRCGAELVRCQGATLSGITITRSGSRLVDVNGATGTLRLANLTLRDNLAGEGVHLTSSQHVQMTGGRVNNAFNTGIYAKDVQTLDLTGVDFAGCAERGASRTAVWLENIGELHARFGRIEPSQGTPDPARVVLKRIGSGAVSVADAAGGTATSATRPMARTTAPGRSAWSGRRLSVTAEDSPTLAVELQ